MKSHARLHGVPAEAPSRAGGEEGLVGTAAGASGGLAIIHVLDRYKLVRIPADVYQVSYVPFVVLPRDFAIVIGAAVLICFVATLYPSRQASRLDPVQALRYE